MLRQRIIAVVTLAAVTLHVLLGCCWHHGHPAASGAAPRVALAEHCGCRHDIAARSHGSREPLAPSDRNDDHGGQDPCDTADCHFMVTKASGLRLSVVSTAMLPTNCDTLYAGLQLALRTSGEANIRDGIIQPHVSPHALKQVWLI